jgi:hypothetical protein
MLADLLMANVSLDKIASCKVVCGPALSALPLSAHPASQKIALVRVSASIGRVKIVRASIVLGQRNVGVTAFYTQVQFAESGNARHVKSCVPLRAVRVSDRRQFVVAVAFGVKGQPFAKLRNAVGEIKTRIPVTWFVWSAGDSIPQGKTSFARTNAG